jgi:hypothetical protein
MLDEFDLQPDPRILQMLGEISLAEWRCLAELIDNSIDGFLHAKRTGQTISNPEVYVNLPTTDNPNARVTVRDNGPGMVPEMLERAVRAGWSGNNAIDSLGMFGMGFNIATARLGTRTTVWTYVSGESQRHGLIIDFEQLRRQRNFRTKHTVQPKVDPAQSGTEVTIENLNPERRAWLAKDSNQSKIRRELSTAYSAMLRDNGVPISFNLYVNNKRILPHRHCVWGDERGVDTTRDGYVPAVILIDRRLPDRLFCDACWRWLAAGEAACPTCGQEKDVIPRIRHVHGWIGLQRFLSMREFGIDFIRNGRKIEIASKELFAWRDGETEDIEYPIDDQRNRGRFVGEIHLDHCRVTYTKDRFDRHDPAWEEMVRLVRGDGPLRPEKAAAAGYGSNESPLFRLFQAFRRTSPQNPKMVGGWRKILVVRDNDRAEEMARKFHERDPDYQEDSRWWELVEEADRQVLLGGAGAGGGTGASGGGLGGLFAGGKGGRRAGKGVPIVDTKGASPIPPAPPSRVQIMTLTREYRHDQTNLFWNVRSFAVKGNDPDLENPANPWRLMRQTTGEWDFLYNPDHPVFRSATLTDLDALLWQLAESVMDHRRGTSDPPRFGSVVSELRDRYAGTLKLDSVALSASANAKLKEIAATWVTYVSDPVDRAALFDDLPQPVREQVYRGMVVAGVTNHRDSVLRGEFLQFATPSAIVDFFVRNPHLFFDGRCWDNPYSTLDFPDLGSIEEAKRRVVKHYEALMVDAAWLAELGLSASGGTPRERLLRAALALDLLTPSTGSAADAAIG